MPEAVALPEASTRKLNEIQRIVDTFVAPSKTAQDIVRSGAWWGPFILLVLVSICFSFTVQKKIGWAAVYDNAISMNPKMKQVIANLPPDQQAVAREKGIAREPYSAYGAPVLSLIFTAIFALLIWPTINFGFGGRAAYGKIFTVLMYSNVIAYVAKFLVALIPLLIGLSPDNFNFQNPVGTNVGYYLSGTGAPLWAVTMGTFFDVFGIWAMIFAVIGCSVVGRVKRSSAAIAIFGWWLLFMLGLVGLVAAVS